MKYGIAAEPNVAPGAAMVTWPICPWLFQIWNFWQFGFIHVLWLNDTSYSKVSEELHRKCRPRTWWYNFQLVHRPWVQQCTASQTDRQAYGWTEISYCV